MDASSRLIKAAKSGNIKDVKKLLTRGALFTKDEFGNTALHEAAWSGNNDITKILMKACSYVDSVNGAGFTPLHLASQNGHAKVAKTLLKWKADATIKNQHDEAPIHLIAKYDHAHLVPIFAAAKVDLDLKARDENTALHIAAKLGNTPTVKALIQSGANPNITNQKNKLPIDYAEISRCQDAIKLLTPFTQEILSKDSKTRKSFFKSRSSRSSSKDIKTKLSFEASVMSHNNSSAVQYRQRSHSIATTTSNNSKRYSREFEDISSYLSNSSNTTGSSTDSRRSQRSKTRSPSLEDLLEEVEKETQGPNYRYPLPSSSDSDTSSVGYHSVNRMSSGSLSSPTSNTSYNFSKAPKLSPNHGGSNYTPSPLLKSPHQSGDFILKPKAMKTVSLNNETEKKDEDYVCLRPSSELKREKLNSVPVLSDEVLNHTYEYLPPLPSKDKDDKPSDAFDSYIEMAPRTDVRPLSTPSNLPKSPLKFSPIHKVAVIGDEMIKNNTKQFSLTDNESAPTKQFDDGVKRNSEMDKYLQDELDTIRHAFQIRLSQMERKYQKQLASVSSLHSNGGADSPKPKDTSSPARLNRASWHGGNTMRHNDGPVATMLGEGYNSGSEESLSSSVADTSTCSSSVFNTTGDSELNNSKMSDNNPTPAAGLTGEMQTLIQEQVQQYKSQMMQVWMKEAEEKMAAMEQSYLQKINSQQKLFHLQSSSSLVDRSETFV